MSNLDLSSAEETVAAALPTPATDIGDLSERLGIAWGVSRGESIVQYLAWSEQAGVFAALAEHGCLTAEGIQSVTPLSESGVHALLPVLLHLGVAAYTDGAYTLTELAREYLMPASPYYIGATLYTGYDKQLPATYLDQAIETAFDPIPGPHGWSITKRLHVQHHRNLGPNVIAARSGLFDRARHLLDMGGGSGTFAIPLALRLPDVQITLADLPAVIPEISGFLTHYGVAHRIALHGMDMLIDEWAFPSVDTMYFGNVFHTCSDRECAELARRAFACLSGGGRIWLHEVLLDEDRRGPLIAVLWNANMPLYRPGARQRTAQELLAMLSDAGFAPGTVVATSGRFSLVGAGKPL